MRKISAFVAGGCSFTQYPRSQVLNPTTGQEVEFNNWPFHVENFLNCNTYYLGHGSADNNFIANRVLYCLQQLLKVTNPKEILVGVMWSGVDRSSFYLSEEPVNFCDHPKSFNLDKSKYGTSFWQVAGNKTHVAHEQNWYLVHPNDETTFAENFYKHYYNPIDALIRSLKNALLVQNFCKLYKINYFFTEYYDGSITSHANLNHPDVEYFLQMLDRSQFLPVKNMADWIEKNTKFKYMSIPHLGIIKDYHPTTEMSYAFTEQVIIPFLKNKGYVN